MHIRRGWKFERLDSQRLILTQPYTKLTRAPKSYATWVWIRVLDLGMCLGV